jgi:hypothetical protein
MNEELLMPFTDVSQDDLNTKHAAEPHPGDYWHEMFCPIRVVLAVTSETVVICEDRKDSGKNHWTWDLTKAKKILRENFGSRLHYESNAMKHKFWCDVEPECHKSFATIWADGDWLPLTK